MTLDLAHQQNGAGPPLVIAHGLFGQARNWATVARALADKRRVIALDMRNHGESPWAESMTYAEMAEDVAAVIAGLPEGRAEVVGHSMGGKAAMVMALRQPELVERLVVVDIAPVSYEAERLMPYVEAMRRLELSALGSRKEADAALARSVGEPGIRNFLLTNLVRGDQGLGWSLNLDAIARAMADLADFPDIDGQYDGPALFLAGGRSPYVPEQVEGAITALFPKAEIRRIPEAGHWVHAEAPQAFIKELKRFLGIG